MDLKNKKKKKGVLWLKSSKKHHLKKLQHNVKPKWVSVICYTVVKIPAYAFIETCCLKMIYDITSLLLLLLNNSIHFFVFSYCLHNNNYLCWEIPVIPVIKVHFLLFLHHLERTGNLTHSSSQCYPYCLWNLDSQSTPIPSQDKWSRFMSLYVLNN